MDGVPSGGGGPASGVPLTVAATLGCGLEGSVLLTPFVASPPACVAAVSAADGARSANKAGAGAGACGGGPVGAGGSAWLTGPLASAAATGAAATKPTNPLAGARDMDCAVAGAAGAGAMGTLTGDVAV